MYDGADGAVGSQLFDAEISQYASVIYARGAHDRDFSIIEGSGRFAFLLYVAILIFFLWHVVRHRLRTRYGAGHKQRRILASDIDRLTDDAIDATLTGIKR